MSKATESLLGVRFRKRPVEIEALQWTGRNLQDVARFIGQRVQGNLGPIYIETLEGRMRADVDDWIVRGVEGEVYPVKPGIFAKTYVPVECACDRLGLEADEECVYGETMCDAR